MSKTEAHALLNAARAGSDYTEAEITHALLLTGDLTPIPRRNNEPREVTHAVPEMSPYVRSRLP